MTAPRPHRTIRRVALVGAALAVLTTGCITGERPNFDENEPTSALTGNEAIDRVLRRLDTVRTASFTADYTVLTKFGNVTSPAVVVQDGPANRRSITVGNVRFLQDDPTIATCDLDTAECEATINDARISDTQLTHQFYGPDFAKRLRIDANRRVGDTEGYTITQAGRQVLCVDVPVSSIVKTYCALDSGPLARYDGNDVNIQLTAITDSVDESKFATS